MKSIESANSIYKSMKSIKPIDEIDARINFAE